MDRLKKITGKFLCEFVVKRILKQAINDELQGSVATYLRCDEVVNDQTKDIADSVSKTNWQSYQQECGCLMHFARWASLPELEMID